MTEVIRVEDFSFRYRDANRTTLKRVSFSVEQGSFFCIVGANGSGKSTLCNALVGLIPHYFVGKSKGSVQIEDIDVAASSIADLSRHVGLVFQNPFNQLSYTAGTVAEELAFGLGNHGVPRGTMHAKVARVAALMHIEDLLDKNPLELSGGQVQRVALGSTLIMEPDILVLDECTAQLDPLGSEEIFDIVKRLNQEGITVVMVDHDMERVARCADQVMVLGAGRVRSIGTSGEVFTDPETAKWGIDIPDYVKLGRGLQDAGFDLPDLPVREDQAVRMIREALR